MNDVIIGSLIAVSGVTTFIICLVFLHIIKTSKVHKHIEKAKANGCVTDGKLIKHKCYVVRSSTEDRGPNKCGYKAVYEYVVNGRTYHKKLKCEVDDTINVYTPQEANVYYDHNRPKKAYFDFETSEHFQSEWLPLTITIILPWVVMFLIAQLCKYLFS